MRVLLLGGTGVLSSAILTECVANGHDTYILNRGSRPTDLLPPDHVFIADLRNQQKVKQIAGAIHFDCVIDFLSYTTENLRQSINLFKNNVTQYIFISSATAYDISGGEPITEERHLVEQGWSYAVNKASCEALLKNAALENGFEYTIIRPYVTYGDTRIPFAVCKRYQQWSVLNRIIKGKPVLLWDDGNAICPLTHVSDFARGVIVLLGNAKAYSQAYHITSEKDANWNQVLSLLGEALGKEPVAFYLPHERIEREFPEYGLELSGDKCRSYHFDNRKIRSLLPGFQCSMDLKSGLQHTVNCFLKDTERQKVDIIWDAKMDRVIAKYTKDKAILNKLRYIPSDSYCFREHFLYIIHRYQVFISFTKSAVFVMRAVKAIKRRLQKKSTE